MLITYVSDSLRMIIGLGTNGELRDDFQTINLESNEPCASLPDYPGGGRSVPMSAVSGGILYVFGGYDGTFYTNDCNSFQNGEWVAEAPMQRSRASAGVAVAFDGRIFITGGEAE